MSRLRYPIGVETFATIREEGYLYVDKTEYIHRLVSGGQFFFLSRPRRFGKSLLLSTVEALFEGRRDLFEGLAICRYDHEWTPSPVFRLNFVNFDTGRIEGLQATLEAQISYWEGIYGSDSSEHDFGQRFFGVIRRAFESTGRKAVILVDEYDKPLFSTIDRPELHTRFKEILKSVYGTLKAADRYIKFTLITGVTRFSRLSIFSDLNNLRDISLNPDYAAICGITEEEMLTVCRDGIEFFAETNGISFEEAFSRLKTNYDGYHFSESSPDIYNPFSLFNAFEDGRIMEYWFATGTPTFLLKTLRGREGDLRRFFNKSVDSATLSETDSYSGNATATLFQTGYLSIKDYDPVTQDYRLGIPNREVETGLFKGLLPVFSGNQRDESSSFIIEASSDLRDGDPEGFMARMQSFLADIPYNLSRNKPEIYFENNLYIISKLLGYRAQTEYHTSRGRIDLLIGVPDYIYVIEIKLDGSAEEAIRQIHDRQYTLPWHSDPRQLVRIGVNFSRQTRNIDSWIIES